MAVLPIYTYGANILRRRAEPARHADNRVVALIIAMFETMRKASGIGLAATQVGRLDRVIVIDVSDVEEYKDVKPLALINPEVISRHGKASMEEGCLSIPEVRGLVERSDEITVRYRDANFQFQEIKAGGLLSRVLLHEIDHLDGVLFIDHLSADARAELAGDLAKIERGEMNVDYPVVTAPEDRAQRVG
jgi:peptide deformylase